MEKGPMNLEYKTVASVPAAMAMLDNHPPETAGEEGVERLCNLR